MIGRPAESEYPPFHAGYVSLVPEEEILAVLTDQLRDTVAFLQQIPDSRAGFRYGAEKWSVAELVGHVIDAERVFGFRAFTFARGDEAPLPGFEQDPYARAARVEGVPLATLAREFGHVRRGHLLLFERLAPSDWLRTGVASGARISVRALGFVMAGHVRHHVSVLRDRYLET
ncbi:MAG: DinB family protein [Thermoanaerobaculia bacterium]